MSYASSTRKIVPKAFRNCNSFYYIAIGFREEKLHRKNQKYKNTLMFELVLVIVTSLIFVMLLFVGSIVVHHMLTGKERP